METSGSLIKKETKNNRQAFLECVVDGFFFVCLFLTFFLKIITRIKYNIKEHLPLLT